MKTKCLNVDINHFSINSNLANFSQNFIYTPLTAKESKLGNIIIAIEYLKANNLSIGANKNGSSSTDAANNLGGPDISLIAESLALDIKSEYYKNNNKNISKAFENAIKKANSAILGLIKTNLLVLENLNILIGSSGDASIHLSKYGKNYVCIFRNGQLTNISPRNKKITSSHKTSLKIFPYLIGGKLYDDDRLIFFNDSVGNICNQEQLESFLENNPRENFNKFQEYLQECVKKSRSSTGRQQVPPLISADVASNIGDLALNPLNFILLNVQTETNQSKIAGFSIKEAAVSAINTSEAKRTESNPKIIMEPQETKEKPINHGNMESLQSKLLKIRLPNLQLPDLIKYSELAKSKISQSILKLKFPLSRKNKIIVSVTFLILLLSTIQIYRNVNAKNQFEELISKISDKRTEALSLISSDDKSPAIAKLIEAKNLSASISGQFPNFNKESAKIADEIENQLNEVAKITVINNPEKISELSNFGIKFKPQNIFKSGNQISVYGSEFGLIYKIDTEDKQKGFSFFSTIEDEVVATIKSSSLVAFFTTSGKTYIFNPQTKNISDFNFTKTDSEIAVLNDKTIDILDKTTKRITRFARNNFSNINRESIGDYQVMDFSSDEKNLFILNDNNKILRVTNMNQEQIIDLNAMPLFGKADTIIANQNKDNIYAINKKQKQIASFKKNGQFVHQYNIGGFDEIVDIFADKDGNAFILSSTAIYKIAISNQ